MEIEVKAVKLPRELIRTISDNPRVIKAFEQLQQLAIDVLPEKIMTGISNLNSEFTAVKKQVVDLNKSIDSKVKVVDDKVTDLQNQLDGTISYLPLAHTSSDTNIAYLPPVTNLNPVTQYLEGV